MTDYTFSTLLDDIEGLAGVDAFTTAEQSKVLGFVNRRARQAYQQADTWARYLKVGQARPAPSGVIPFTYTNTDGNRNISTATRSGDTVTVVTTADIDGDFVTGQYVTIAGLSYVTANPNGSYQVTVTDDATFTYDLNEDLTSMETYTGSGTVAPAALSEVDTFIRVFDVDPNATTGGSEYSFYVDTSGCHVINAGDYIGFFTTYKRAWDGPYTSSSTTIPREFANYLAHAAYADFLRMDQQVSKAMAEEQVAKEYLLVELDRPQNQMNGQQIGTFRTHASQQAR